MCDKQTNTKDKEPQGFVLYDRIMTDLQQYLKLLINPSLIPNGFIKDEHIIIIKSVTECIYLLSVARQRENIADKPHADHDIIGIS